MIRRAVVRWSGKEGTPRRLAVNQRLGRWDVTFSPFLYVSPFFVLFALVGLFPLLYTGWVSLHDWDLIGGQGRWVGVDNFGFILHQRQFWIALRNTVSIFLLSAIPQLIAAIVIAAVLDTNLRNRTFWRMSVLLPFVVMPVAVALIFGSMFGERFGLVNTTPAHTRIGPTPGPPAPLAPLRPAPALLHFLSVPQGRPGRT